MVSFSVPSTLSSEPSTPWLCERVAARLAAAAAEGEEALRSASAEIRGWILDLELPSDLVAEMERAHIARIPTDSFVAVRSSAAGEDAAGESFAAP